jgi:O-methyltransferase involved in polyketide biosynthesis
MMEKRKVADLSPVERTLLLPLAYRAIESRQPNPILMDSYAIEILNSFDEELVPGDRSPDMDQIATMMRCRCFDQYARSFIDKHPSGIVVDIGCGLDTRFRRIDNGQMLWFGLDLPEVIAIRQQVLPETARGRLIAASVLDFPWMDCIPTQFPVLFLAEGVFPYFERADVRKLMTAMSARFPGSDLVFDAISSLSVIIHRFSPTLSKTRVHLGWGLDDSRELETWEAGIRLVYEDLYCTEKEPRLGFYHYVLSFPPFARMSRILHVRFQGPGS